MAIFLKPTLKQLKNEVEKRGSKIEIAAAIFAVFNCIFTFISSIFIGVNLYSLSNSLLRVIHHESVHMSSAKNIIIVHAVMVLMCKFSITAFCFSIVLARGVFKRNASYVKMYFWYGVAVVILSLACVLGLTVLVLTTYFKQQPLSNIVFAFFGANALYAPFLIVVRCTYKKFERETESFVEKEEKEYPDVHYIVAEKC